MTAVDDLSVADSTSLYRRIHPNHVVPDQNRDCQRVSTAAFKDEEMSVWIEDTLRDTGRTPPDCLIPFPGQYLVGLETGQVRHEEQIVRRSELPGEPAHGDVIGRKKPRSRQQRFCDMSWWEVAPDGACD